MNVLHLFAGAGGGVLADRLLGHTSVGYVEWEPYCQKVLQARIADGLLDSAPIFGDVRHFVSSGLAREYRGVADVVAGGFPCQPFSVAGKRAGSGDDRHMWPAFRDVVLSVGPRYVFAENVPGLLTWDGGSCFAEILKDLAEAGYVSRWAILGASAVGAPHQRKRLWLLATDPDRPWRRSHLEERGSAGRDTGSGGDGAAGDVADADAAGPQGRDGAELRERAGELPFGQGCSWWDIDPADLPDAGREGCECGRSGVRPAATGEVQHAGFADGCDVPDADGSGQREQRGTESRGAEHAAAECGGARPAFAGLGRIPDELADRHDLIAAAFGGQIPRVARNVPDRVARLRAIGNGQVSACAAAAWLLLGGPVE